jgi:CubicO group peptidase (beta-lactamase class C family)
MDPVAVALNGPGSRRQMLVLSARAAAAIGLLAAAGQVQAPTASSVTLAAPAAPARTGPGATIQSTLAPDASGPFLAVAEAVMHAMAAAEIPGVALGILDNGREEVAGLGVANVETGEPVTPETLFQLGSVTKTYTATALMRLVEQGRVELDLPVRTYVPDFRVADPDASAQVTIRHLLTHTGGWWGDSVSETGTGPDALANFMATKMPTFPQLAPVGRYFSYNNTGLDVVGRIMEVVADTPYRDTMQELLLGPLELEKSTFTPEAVLAAPYADGHATTPGGVVVQQPLFIPRNSDPAGGLHATPHDVLRYARFQMGDGTAADGTRLLEAGTLRQMQSPQGPRPPAGGDIGFTWFVHTSGLPRFEHLGATYGQTSELLVVPDRGFAVVVIANLQPAGGAAIAAAVRAALREYLGLESAASPAPAAPLSLPEAELAAYAGRYAVPDLSISLRVEDGALILRSTPIDLPDQVQLAVKTPVNTPDLPPRAPLIFLASDVATTGGEAAVRTHFVRRPDGQVGWLSVYGILLFPRLDAA